MISWLYSHMYSTGYGSKDGNNMNNMAMPWNIYNIFGMLEDLCATKKATSNFFTDAKIG